MLASVTQAFHGRSGNSSGSRGFASRRERRDVAVELDRNAFAYYDAEEGWTVSPGTFEITIGRSSRDICGEVSIEVE